jgi:uncharacterized repeat protein (TIGR02543 family)
VETPAQPYFESTNLTYVPLIGTEPSDAGQIQIYGENFDAITNLTGKFIANDSIISNVDIPFTLDNTYTASLSMPDLTNTVSDDTTFTIYAETAAGNSILFGTWTYVPLSFTMSSQLVGIGQTVNFTITGFSFEEFVSVYQPNGDVIKQFSNTGSDLTYTGVITIPAGTTHGQTFRAQGLKGQQVFSSPIALSANVIVSSVTQEGGDGSGTASLPIEGGIVIVHGGNLSTVYEIEISGNNCPKITDGTLTSCSFKYNQDDSTISFFTPSFDISGNISFNLKSHSGASGLGNLKIEAPDPDPTVTQMTINPSDLTLTVGHTATLNVIALPSNAADQTFTDWQTSDDSIADVHWDYTLSNHSATVTGLQPGIVSIYAVSLEGTLTAEATVTVVPAYASTPIITSINPTYLPAIGGGTVTITGQFLDSVTDLTISGIPVSITAATGETMAFTAPALGQGDYTLVLTNSDGTTTVPNALHYVNPSLVVSDYSFVAGATVTVHGAGYYPGESVIVSFRTQESATITTNTVIADANGTFTGLFIIPENFPTGEKFYATGETSGVIAESQVILKLVPVTNITAEPQPIILTVGDTQDLTVSVFPYNATDSTYYFVNHNQDLVAIYDNTLSALSAGVARISVHSNSDPSISTDITATIVPAYIPVTSIQLSNTSTVVDPSQTFDITYTVLPLDATDQTVAFVSDDTSVATVNSAGRVTAQNSGTTTITVSSLADPSITGEFVVTVNDPFVPITSISVYPQDLTLTVGDQTDLTVSVFPYNATDNTYYFTNSNNSVLANYDNTISALAPGVSTITVYLNSDPSISADTTISVVPVPPVQIPVTGIAINLSMTTLDVSNTLDLTQTVYPADATNTSVVWSSSNSSIASVSNEGKVTARYFGTATITATTVDGGYTATSIISVPVPKIPVRQITVSQISNTLTVGQNHQFVANILPVNATNKDVTWSSSNSSVADVTNSGLVNALSVGTVTIYVTAEDTGQTATALVSIATGVVHVTGISVSPGTTTLMPNVWQQLSINVLPQNAVNKGYSLSVLNNKAGVGLGTTGAAPSLTYHIRGTATGTATLKVTTTDGGFIGYSYITISNTTPVIPDGSVTYGKDTFNFINSTTDFIGAGQSNNYEISDRVKTRMFKNLTPVEKTLLSLGFAQTWGGSCFGMSTVFDLVKSGQLSLSKLKTDWTGSFPAPTNLTSLTAPKSNSNVRDVVNFYQMLQMTNRTGSARSKFATGSANPLALQKIVSDLQTSNYPVEIGLRSNGGGHAVIGYDITTSNNGWKIKIWNPNKSTIYPEEFIWISNNYTNFEVNVPGYTATDGGYPYWSITVESNDLNHIDYFTGDIITGFNLLADAPAGDKMLSLETNYKDFTINASNGKSAFISDGEKVSGDLSISSGIPLNEIGEETKLNFLIPENNSVTYSISPIVDNTFTEKSSLSNSDSNDGFFSSADTEGKCGVAFGTNGKVSTNCPTSLSQTLEMTLNNTTNDFYNTKAIGSDDAIAIEPNLADVSAIKTTHNNVSVSLNNDFSEVSFTNVDATGDGIETVQGANNIDLIKDSSVLVSKPYEHSIVFDSNGGGQVNTLASVAQGSVATKPTNPTKAGYIFEGWFTDQTLSSAYDWSTAVFNDITLYAKWSNQTIKTNLSIVGNKYSGATLTAKSLTYVTGDFKPGTISWYIGSKKIATGTKYKVAAGDAGKTLTIKQAGTRTAAGKVYTASTKTVKVVITKLGSYKHSVTKIKVAKKAMTVSWKKLSSTTIKNLGGVTKIQILYSKDGKNWSIKEVGIGKSSLKIKKLTKKKKYQVKLRLFRSIGNAKYYSAYGNVKKSGKIKA